MIVLVVLGIYAWAGRLGAYALIAVAVLLGILSWKRNQDYGSDLSIWNDTVAKRPENARAHNNLGEVLTRVGRETEALPQFQSGGLRKPKQMTTERACRIAERNRRLHYEGLTTQTASAWRAFGGARRNGH